MIETRIVPVGAAIPTTGRTGLRFLPDADFIRDHASGTLRKAAQHGIAHADMLREERLAFELGWGFRSAPATRVLVGPARIESDCRALTEAVWHIHRIVTLNPFPSVDVYEAAYLQYTPAEGLPEQGVGVVLTQTHCPFVPRGHIVFAIIAALDPVSHTYRKADNPC